ncbi:mediator of RNA polymerase II transcription subunit 15-like [Ixodes scapularis]
MATLQKKIEELEVNFQPGPQHQVSSQPQAHPSPQPPLRDTPQSQANHLAPPPASNKQPQQEHSQPPPSQGDLKSQMQVWLQQMQVQLQQQMQQQMQAHFNQLIAELQHSTLAPTPPAPPQFQLRQPILTVNVPGQ